MFCCAQFTEDDGWYRARIVESHAKGDMPRAQVIYVDFGNHEPLPTSRLRMLRKEHAELPMMAILCALDGAVPADGVRHKLVQVCHFIETLIVNLILSVCKFIGLVRSMAEIPAGLDELG